MNKTEDNALNKRLAELLGWKWQGYTLEETSYDEILMDEYETPKKYFTPTTDKAQAMELLIEYELALEFVKGAAKGKQCQCWNPASFTGRVCADTHMEAIVRAVIKMLESK